MPTGMRTKYVLKVSREDRHVVMLDTEREWTRFVDDKSLKDSW